MIREMPKYGQFRLGNLTVRLPIIENTATTERIVEELVQRLQAIEADAERVDTQLFAIQAAFEYAAEGYRLRQEHDRAEKDLIKALDALSSRLRDMATRFEPKG